MGEADVPNQRVQVHQPRKTKESCNVPFSVQTETDELNIKKNLLLKQNNSCLLHELPKKIANMIC